MAKQQDDGSWLVKCPLCSWKESVPTKVEASANLNNHLSITHSQGAQKRVKPKHSPRPAKDMPPQLPTPIKENK